MKHLKLAAAAVAAVGFVGLMASPAFAAGIATSPHNMSFNTTGDNIYSDDGTNQNNGEICVYCHTPHGADMGVGAPLWNRTTGGAGFETYDSLSIDGEILAVGSVSLACLGCHDGSKAIDVVINAPGSTTAAGQNLNEAISTMGVMTGFKAIGEAGAGNQLKNDHPIGVQYGRAVDAADTEWTVMQTSSALGGDGTMTGYWVDSRDPGQTAAQRDKEDMILYSRTATAGIGAFVECGSCHDPHNTSTATNDTATPIVSNQVNFLRMSNAGSELCLSCHVK